MSRDDPATGDPLLRIYSAHPRRWREFRYCYPVISRRSRGLSLGVNLNPDTACNFDCVYCCIDRTRPPAIRDVDLAVVAAELDHLIVAARRDLFDEPEFRDVPTALRRINDIAFSGDGEPTASPDFAAAARIAADARQRHRLDEVRLITITDACYLKRPAVAAALAFLDGHNGEIWAKLDAGTEAYFRLVDRPPTGQTLEHVLDNILFAGRLRPIVIQSLFMRVHGQPPTDEEVAAYAGRIAWLLDSGAKLSQVQVYTIARRTAEPFVAALDAAELELIADAVRPLGVPVECYP